MKLRTTCVMVQPKPMAELKALADVMGTSTSSLIRLAIREYLRRNPISRAA